MPNPLIHTSPGEKVVAYFSTRNLYHVLPAAYNSLLAFTPGVRVFCFIEDDTLPYKTPKQVTCVNVKHQEFFDPNGPCFNTGYTYMILLKAALTKIFPDADKALILDVDTIVCDDLSGLWDWDLSHAYYAAVVEPEGSRLRGVPYANFGVVMMNLNKLRSSGKDDEIILDLNTHQYLFPEQDAFNKICGNRFDPLPPDYNVTNFGFDITGNPKRTYVKHYAGFKHWEDVGIVKYWLTHTKPYPRYVVYAGDHRVYNMMLSSLKSLLAHSPVDKVFFLIEHDSFPHPLPPCVQCINVSNQSIFDIHSPNFRTFYSYMTMLRAGLTRILPQNIDRVLWLDPDTIVYDDISDIWNYDLEHHYFAAVEEVRNHNHSLKPYFNAGVMLMNLAKFRNDRMDERIIHEINTVAYEHLEQDVLNYLCFMHIMKLPSSYSDSYVSKPCNNPRIKHFLADAKREFFSESKQYDNLSAEQLVSIQSTLKAGELCER